MMEAMNFDITAFGANPAGNSLCTNAVNAAIEACVAAGGGTVLIPSGKFLTGPIELKSNIQLRLDAGARLVFNDDPGLYPIVESRWEGAEVPVFMPMIYGRGVRNVSVIGLDTLEGRGAPKAQGTLNDRGIANEQGARDRRGTLDGQYATVGQGTLDGQGSAWWKAFRNKQLPYPRPRLISFEDCDNVSIENIACVNSPSWTIHPIRCSNVAIRGLHIKNPSDSPNTDGINPDSCSNVHISGCHIDVGDDCITLKSGTEKSAYRIACENIVITGCTLAHGHGGVVIGSEMSGGVRNVSITDCIFDGTDRGIRMKTRRGRGGIVEDIRISNCVMEDVLCPIVMHQFYFCGEGGKEIRVWDKNPHPVELDTPAFHRIHFYHITARNASIAAAFLYGLPEMPISDVSFNTVNISMKADAQAGIPAMMDGIEPVARRGFICRNTKNLSFTDVAVTGYEGLEFNVK